MLRMLIVDDNDFERNALRNYIDWSILGIHEVDTAHNGQDGLEKAKAFKPDIIISDIKMPVMDGIEMARQIRTFNPNMKFIFSSGYEDVELLKEALEVRAYNYLIKPVLHEELIKAVRQTVSVLMDERLASMESSKIIGQYRENLHLLQLKFLESLVLSPQKPEDVNALFLQANNLQLRMSGDYRLALIDMDFENEADISDEASKVDMIIYELKKAFKADNVTIFRIEHNKIIVVIHSLKGRPDLGERCIADVSLLVSELADKFKSRYFIGVSAVSPNLTDLYLLFKQCSRAVNRKIELGYGHMVLFEELEEKASETGVSGKNTVRKVIGEITELVLNSRDVDDKLRELVNAAAKEQKPGIDSIQSAFVGLFSFLARQMENSGENFEKAAGDELDLYNMIISARTTPDIVSLAGNVLDSISSYMSRKKINKDDHVVKEILNILNNESDKPITLSYLSERVYLSPNYLRIIFKDKMNTSIQDYLTGVRMNKAKEMLRTSHLKVQEIGAKVGYENSTYFNIVFKDCTGITPGEYRSKFMSHGNMEDI